MWEEVICGLHISFLHRYLYKIESKFFRNRIQFYAFTLPYPVAYESFNFWVKHLKQAILALRYWIIPLKIKRNALQISHHLYLNVKFFSSFILTKGDPFFVNHTCIRNIMNEFYSSFLFVFFFCHTHESRMKAL